MRPTILATIAAAAFPMAAPAQSNIDPNRPFSWPENIGWMNWRHEAPNPGDGVFVADNHLEGFIWCENIGWVNLGNVAGGDPNDPNQFYANNDDTDFGVNLDEVTGLLSGFAWGENVGWIHFDGGALAAPPNAARLIAGCRFRGYGWGENIGWINLDDATHFVALLLNGDANGDGVVNLTDLAIVLANFGVSGPTITRSDGDLDGDKDVDLSDLAIVLAEFGQSCP